MIIKKNQVPAERAERESFGVADLSYLIVGTRVNQDVCHYPDTGRTLHTDGKAWRLLEADGQLFKAGVF